MKPVTFKYQTSIVSSSDPEVEDLPIFRCYEERLVISCWRPSLWERIRILFGGGVWLSVQTTDHLLAPVWIDSRKMFSVVRETTR